MDDDSIDTLLESLDTEFIDGFSSLFDDDTSPPTLDNLNPPLSEPVVTNHSSYGNGDANNNESGLNHSGASNGLSLEIIGRPSEEQVINHETSATRFCSDNNESDRNHFVGDQASVDNITSIPISEPNFNQNSNSPQFFNYFNQSGENWFQGETSGTSGIPPETWDSTVFGNPMEIPMYPVPPVPYGCTCCQVLREIVHTNGDHFTKLELHGRVGLISHAVLESRYTGLYGDPIPPKYEMFDFCKKSLEAVRDMLTQYCENRKRADYVMLEDPFRTYYEALYVGFDIFDYEDFLNYDFGDAFETCPLNASSPDDADNNIQTQPVANDFQGYRKPHAYQMGQATVVPPPPKRSRVLQRQRTKNLTLRDFAGCYDMPIEEAAKVMGVCTTVVKAICRRNGLARWPFRRIRSVRRQITMKQRIVGACSEYEKRRVEAELQQLEIELDRILANFFQP